MVSEYWVFHVWLLGTLSDYWVWVSSYKKLIIYADLCKNSKVHMVQVVYIVVYLPTKFG